MAKTFEANERTQSRWRSIIKTEEILKRVQGCALGTQKMTSVELRASEIILRKVAPDLTSTQLTADAEAGLPVLKIIRNDSAAA